MKHITNYKPKDFAELLNVSVKTLQRWDKEVILIAKRTPTDRRYYIYGQYLQFKEINNLNSFSLISLLTNLCYAKAGILGNGLDLIMINGVKLRKANGDNITINELEGVDYQLETINKTFTWEYLKKYLNDYSNSNINEEVDIAKNLFNAYKTGDIEFIEESNNKMKNDSPEYYKIMLTDRNIGMTNKIDELIKDGKKHTVAVGAAHFIGDDGILKLLEEKGYKITRVN